MSRTPAKCGTYSGYRTHHARGTTPCEPCRAAMRAYDGARRAKRQRLIVPADEAMRKIRGWLEEGATLDTISAASGTPKATLAFISAGQRTNITRYTHDRIVNAPQPEFGAYLPIDGTRRRLEALQALGWSLRSISRRLGHERSWANRVLSQQRVSRANAAAISQVYDELSMTPGPSRWVAGVAAKNGRVVPLAWDDDTIDDPGAWASLGADEDDHVDHVVVDTLVDRYPYADWRALNATRPERLAALARLDYREQRARLKALGWQDNQIDLPSTDAVLRYLGLRSDDVVALATAVAS